MLWSRHNPPIYQPDAILTRYGWTHPVTGELLIPIFDESLGPGKNIRQKQSGTARITQTTMQTQSGVSRIGVRKNVTTMQRIAGTARIEQPPTPCNCPIPYYTGINPSW